MEPGTGEAAVGTPPEARRPRRAVALAAALATFWVSAAIGCVAVRRWRRALFWLLTDWAWMVVFVVGAVSGHPRLWWGGLLGFIGWRVPAALDAYRVVARARAEATWPTLVKAWLVLTVGATVMAAGVIRPFFAEAFLCPSKSMFPTLIVGDHLMVDKLHHSVHRGDVVVFKWPADPTRALEGLLDSQPAAAATLRRFSGTPTNALQAANLDLFTYILGEQQRRWGGNPYDNRNTIYTGTGDDVAVNDGVKRYRADDRARAQAIAYYSPTGRLERPLLSVRAV